MKEKRKKEEKKFDWSTDNSSPSSSHGLPLRPPYPRRPVH